MKLESFLWYLSISVIVVISLYVFYAYFSGEMTGFGAFTLLLVTFAVFGFLMGVASHLASQRKGGWAPEEERARLRRSTVRPGKRSEGIVLGYEPRYRYGRYKKALLVILAVGILLILQSPVLGLSMVVMAAASYIVLRAVEVFDVGEEP